MRLPLLLLPFVLLFSACASKQKQSTSSWRMIDEGDNNPFIHDAPEHAGTTVKDANNPRNDPR